MDDTILLLISSSDARPTSLRRMRASCVRATSCVGRRRIHVARAAGRERPTSHTYLGACDAAHHVLNSLDVFSGDDFRVLCRKTSRHCADVSLPPTHEKKEVQYSITTERFDVRHLLNVHLAVELDEREVRFGRHVRRAAPAAAVEMSTSPGGSLGDPLG